MRRLTLLLPFALAACAAASTPWQHPDLPKSQWSGDWSACRRYAERQVGYRDDDSPSPLRDYDRSQAKRQIDAYASACMRERGYLPAKPSR